MYQQNIKELNKTAREKETFNLLNDSIKCATGATLSYQYYLSIINKRLKDMYGNMADWSVNLGAYLNSDEMSNLSLFVNNINDVLELTTDIIYKAIYFEEENEKLADKTVKLYDNWKEKNDICYLTKSAEILGVLPADTGESLNNYYVLFPSSAEEKNNIRNRILKYHINELDIVVGMIVDFYREGFLYSFPFVGTMITQKRGKVYWRGENAYYGSSKPCIYRNTDNLPPLLSECIIKMRYDECGLLLDMLNAPIEWSKWISDVNYMAIMQHYGLPTHMMDVTSDLKTALFFACCKWNQQGAFSRWEPLKKEDFIKVDSRPWIAKMGGDSRYGMIFKERSEIEDLMWIVVDDDQTDELNMEYNKANKHVIPVGYQPFNRCKSQHAYMLLGIYDLYTDMQFDKAKFKLDEEFCYWIYKEMDEGRAIYPHNDVPDLSSYFGKIAKTRIFSKSVFDNFCELNNISSTKKDNLKDSLLKEGYIISNKDIDFISKEEIDEINNNYSLDDALKNADVQIKSRPILVI